MPANCSKTDILFGYEINLYPHQSPPLPWLYDFINLLFMNLTPVYLPMAAIGNALSVVVFRRPAMSAMSHGFILIATTDLLVLFICMLWICLVIKGYVDPCKLLYYYLLIWIRIGFLTFGHWLLILVSIEQTVAIFRPKKGKTGRKISGGKIFCLYISLLIFTFFINLPYLFAGLLGGPILIDFYNFMDTFNNIITRAIPFIIMFGLDIAILVKLCTKGTREQKMRKANQKEEISLSAYDGETGEKNSGELDKWERNTKKDAVHGHETFDRSCVYEGAMVIVVLNVAAILFDISNSVVRFLNIFDHDIITATVFLIFTRHTFNFFLYFSSFHFRQEFIRVFCRCRQHSSSKDSPLGTAPLQTVTGSLSV